MKHLRRLLILFGTTAAVVGSAVAAPESASATGVYHSAGACYAAGTAGISAGQWSTFDCQSLLSSLGKPLHVWVLLPDAF